MAGGYRGHILKNWVKGTDAGRGVGTRGPTADRKPPAVHRERGREAAPARPIVPEVMEHVGSRGGVSGAGSAAALRLGAISCAGAASIGDSGTLRRRSPLLFSYRGADARGGLPEDVLHPRHRRFRGSTGQTPSGHPSGEPPRQSLVTGRREPTRGSVLATFTPAWPGRPGLLATCSRRPAR